MTSQIKEEKTMKLQKLFLTCAVAASMIAPAALAGMPDDIREGTFVELEGNLVGDKLVMAMDIEVTNAVQGDAAVKGMIKSFDPVARTINIAGIDVVTATDALVQDEENLPMDFTGFIVGRRGKAEGTWKDGILTAHRIKLKRIKGDRENEVDLSGMATKVNRKGESFTVNGVEVLLTPTTVVEVQ